MKSLALNSALVVGAVVVCVAAALALDAWLNLGLRMGIARLFERNVQEPEPIMYVYDNGTGWRLNPRTQYHRARSGPFLGFAGLERYDTRLRVNSEGFIDRDHFLKTPYYRIAFVGNSWLEAVQQEYGNRFAPLTEDYVFARSDNRKVVEIMNFGLSNAAPAHAYGVITNYVLKYRPDEIWLFVTAADLRSNTPIDTPPPFGPTFEFTDASETELKDIRFGHADPPAYASWKRRRELGRYLAAAADFNRVMAYHYSPERDFVYDRVWRDMRLSVSLIKKTLDAQRIRLRVVYIPPSYEVDMKRWEEYRRRAFKALGREVPMDRALGERRYAELANGLGIELVSLTPLCIEKGAGEMYSDHFSRMGHHWVAEHLARHIAATVAQFPSSPDRER